jgi:hypothetical protein
MKNSSEQTRLEHGPEERTRILERNLWALTFSTPALVARIRAAEPRDDLRVFRTDDAALAGEIRFNGQSHRLCSMRRPMEEATRLADSLDPKVAAVAVVIGFGMGHHVRALTERLKGQGTVVVFEPDVALLRAVLSEVDCCAWLASPGVRIHAGGTDTASVSLAFEGLEGQATSGIKIMEHPPSRVRLGDAASDFAASLSTVVATVRTHVITALCQVEKTVGHFLRNAAVYAAAGSVEDLRGCAKGRTAVVVSAGPSLERNIHLLAQPGVRERVVIIAAQTVLKPLLARGIRPHFVTALDHSEISARFFEGLTAEDLKGVTLVVEPKANPAIPGAFPGTIRCSREPVLDEIFGSGLARNMGALKSGSTVAHLSYYLARHMGCDPVALIGQDLGFTDGQYYSAGAAIHQVWSGELNEFNTLEMMEWQRIVRMKRMLHRAKDHLGRDMYTDEQMLAYRLQFEREFGLDKALGLTTLDATEGGVRKEHTTITTLRDVLNACSKDGLWEPPAVSGDAGLVSPQAVVERLEILRRDAGTIKAMCAKTQKVLGEMYRYCGNHARVNPLVEQAQKLGVEAEAVGTAYKLVQYINQTGQIKRYRRDRLIALDGEADPVERQRRQIERDRENMRWLSDSADELIAMTTRAIDGQRGLVVGETIKDRAAMVTGEPGPKAKARVGVVLAVNTRIGGLDNARDLGEEIASGRGALWWTVSRLLKAEGLDLVVVATAEADRVAILLGDLAKHPRVLVRATAEDPMATRRRSVAAARRWSRSCWRGGIGNLTAFDEAFSPATTAAVMREHNLDAAVIVGADWCLVDPASVQTMVTRYRAAGSETGTHQLMIVHAAPGLGACLIERGPIEELATGGAGTGPFSSVGALTGYLPFAPQMDLIGKPAAIMRSVAARDLGVRCIADHPWARRVMRDILTKDGVIAPLDAVVAAFTREARTAPPSIVTFDLGGPGRWMSAETVERFLRAAGSDAAVTFRSSGEPADHPGLAELVRSARGSGAMVRVVTHLGNDAGSRLRALEVEVVDVPMVNADGSVHESAGIAAGVLVDGVTIGAEGLPNMWVVPRLTRRDAMYDKLEDLYDAWLMRTGACVIEPLAEAIEGERIAPLPIPAAVMQRREREEIVVGPDGIGRTPGGSLVTLGGVVEIKSGAVAAAEAA